MDHRLRSCQLFPGAIAVHAPTGRAQGSAFPPSLPALIVAQKLVNQFLCP